MKKKNILNKTWVSYGKDVFEPEMFAFAVPDRRTNYLNKPLGGLWASPTDSKWGWKDWCLSEGFNVSSLAHSFEFKLSDTARIYVIDNEDDLVRISNAENNIGQYGIDYDMLLKEGYDGLFVTAKAAMEFHYYVGNHVGIASLYSWDCESICVFNKDVVKPIN